MCKSVGLPFHLISVLFPLNVCIYFHRQTKSARIGLRCNSKIFLFSLWMRQFEYIWLTMNTLDEEKTNYAASFSFEFHLNTNSNCFDKFVTVHMTTAQTMGK